MTFVLDHIGLSTGDMPVITDVSLTLEKGTMNILLGPTLSGKTTLMRLMAGLDKPTVGRILSDGFDVTGVSVRRRSVAMVYQQFVNYPSLTVYENIASPLRVAGVPRAEVDVRVREAARFLRLEELLQRLPGQLSGGQQQRTAIARALVKRAELVLLDEPLANLDYKLREELREELPKFFARSGAILVYATTEPMEALLLGGITIALHEGRVTQIGPDLAVYRRPDNIETARAFSDPPLNELAIEKRGGLVTLDSGRQLPAAGALSRCRTACTGLAFALTPSRSARRNLRGSFFRQGRRDRNQRLGKLRSCRRRRRIGSAWSRACTTGSPARRLTVRIDAHSGVRVRHGRQAGRRSLRRDDGLRSGR